MDDIIIQVNFSAQTPYGEFRDALNIPKDEYDSLSEKEIEDRKQARITKWVAFMDNVKANPAPAPTKAQLQLQASELSSRLSTLNSKIAGM